MAARLAQCIEHILPLQQTVMPVLALGASFQNTVCLLNEHRALISQTHGSLEVPNNCKIFEHNAREFLALLSATPRYIAHDLNPDFHSTRFAELLASELHTHLLPVQHHHAHVAAVCAEHQIEGHVIGLALDGTGLGSDHKPWGGELLTVNGAKCERIGHLRGLPMPGGDRAALEPWRMAAAVMHLCGAHTSIASRFSALPAARMVAEQLQRSINTPYTSSMGRLFDATAGLLGLSDIMSTEAEAAIALETAATRHIQAHGWPAAREDGWQITPSNQLDLLPMLNHLIHRQPDPVQVDALSAIFHATLIESLYHWVLKTARHTRLTRVILSGGCFLNRLLVTRLRTLLEAAALQVFTGKQLAPGDSAISLGQAWVAAHLEIN